MCIRDSNVSTWRGEYVLTVKYAYSIPIPEPMARVSAFLDKIGGILNPATVWQRIPFSFIVDWFVDVDSYLRNLRIDQLPVDIVIEGATESLKWTCDSKTVGRIETVQFDTWVEQAKQYVRTPLTSSEVMDTNALRLGTGINNVKAGLIASLIEVRLASPRKWRHERFKQRFAREVARTQSRLNAEYNLDNGGYIKPVGVKPKPSPRKR